MGPRPIGRGMIFALSHPPNRLHASMGAAADRPRNDEDLRRELRGGTGFNGAAADRPRNGPSPYRFRP